jgi:hypothetical protein
VRVLYTQICEHAEAGEDERMTAHGVFRRLYAPGFPAQQDRMVLIVAIEWDADEEGQQEFRIDLLDPARSPVLTVNGHTDVQPHRGHEPPPMTRLIMPIDEAVFPVPGRYDFVLHVAGERISAAPLYLLEDGSAGAGPD